MGKKPVESESGSFESAAQIDEIILSEGRVGQEEVGFPRARVVNNTHTT